ncbi:MAG: hypothetical protein IT456_15800 [Planctomycetes bacterium]|nr:hypothetical protein [Planctomycetota bacterium]
MTLPNQEVMDLLSERFVIGWQNIERQTHVGISHGYKCDQTAVGTTNGAGGRNVQLVVMATDETVVHVLPGFWNAEDLLSELRLALDLHDLYRSEEHSAAQKQVMFSTLHRSFLRKLTPEAIGRSRWQDFDQWEESNRGKAGVRDTFALNDLGQPMVEANGRVVLKPVVQVVHERLLQRPWKKLTDFGMESFVDYGRAFYDNNAWVDKGRNFPQAVKANELREKALAKDRLLAEKAAKAAQKRKN